MQVIVISMADSGERRRSISRQLRQADISFEIFDGVRGDAAIRDCIFEGFDERAFFSNTGRHAVIGEIGCFASHRKLWRRCVESDEPIMIIEDDSNLLPGFVDALESASEVIHETGFLRLQVAHRISSKRLKSIRDFHLVRLTAPPDGAMAYCISPTVARQFLDATRIINAPLTIFLKKYWEHGQPLYALTPFTVAPSVLSVETTITGRAGHGRTWYAILRRFRRLLYWRFRAWLFNRRIPGLNRLNRKQSGDARSTATHAYMG